MSRPLQEDRCSRTGLYHSQCGHCQNVTPQPPIFLEPGPRLVEEQTHVVNVYPLDRTGRCDTCGQTIPAGAWISHMSDNAFLCSECAPT